MNEEIYDSREYESSVTYKADNSPLTIADLEAHGIIVSGLEKFEIPVISEEGYIPSFEERKDWKQFWMVDPLDGTEKFLKRNEEFTINIALIEDNHSVFGVIYLPVQKALYYGSSEGAFKQAAGEAPQRIEVRKQADPHNLTAIVSRSHFSEEDRRFLEENHIAHYLHIGSSIKFCIVAEGQVDVYCQSHGNMEWDTAAGQTIVEAAGGRVLDRYRRDLRYNKSMLANGPYLCFGRAKCMKLMIF
ncbi:MAG: 3'(2'),5'-bisphosphate nucleotidase CysQ [Methanotrichaceae archaeon]